MSGLDKDIIMSSDSEGLGDFLPPPHIQARIYRSSTSSARRKSSAASSRRNSMSSHHSSRSARSVHGEPQSTHIAQHLRRASLLETRKARLAEKAAHAEKVRLRAAMAKAAPRVNANSEERALAAQQARERYLAQVAANCHEEVKRAKRVAEDTREKKAAEHLRLKGEMEERLAEAERRRAVYQQNLRRAKNNNALAPVEEKKVVPYVWKPRNDHEAATLLQRAWRNRQWRKAVSEFKELGLGLDNMSNKSFDDLGVLLSQDRALTLTTRTLEFCGLQDNDGIPTKDRTAVRTFLSAFLIHGHPKQVLSSDGVQEQDLISKAKSLLEAFEILLSDPRSPSFLPALTAPFLEAYSSFRAAFSAWKNHDSSVLVGTMIAQFVELDAIWQSVRNDTNGGVSDDYREGIQQNQTLILIRLKRILGHGEAMTAVKDAVKEARRAKSRKKKAKPAMETRAARPRATSNATTLPLGRPDDATHTSSVTELEWAHHAQELSRATTSLPSNRTIMHELAINREYRIDLTRRADTREAILQAVSDDLRQGLSSGLGDVWIVAMAQTVRDKLLGLVQPGKSLHNLISEALDPSVIAKQVKMGAFSYQKFFSFFHTILPKLCAPVRDPEVKALAEDRREDPIERFAKLNYVVDLLSLDNANFTLQMHAPMLLEQAASYEQSRFIEMLGDRPLTKTARWWKRASDRIREESSRRTGESAQAPSNRITPNKVYMQGLVDLAVAVMPLEEPELPETLDLDHDRIVRIRSDVLRVITIESILLTAKNLLKRDVRSQWKAEAHRIWDLSYDDPQAFLSALPQAMPPTTKTALFGTTERVLQDAKCGRATHPVMKVLLQKLKTHVFTRLSAASADERIRATTTATEVLASSGLSEVVVQVGSMVDELRKVADVDREAHGKWYDEIAASTNG